MLSELHMPLIFCIKCNKALYWYLALIKFERYLLKLKLLYIVVSNTEVEVTLTA